MVDELTFRVYKSYLVRVAEKEGRAFKLPKTTETLEKRNDLRFFIVLSKQLKESGIVRSIKIQKFLNVASDLLKQFHVSDIVDNFETVKEKYKEVKEDSLVESKKKIKKTFDSLIEYCIINNVKDERALAKGSPPIIMKLWKNGFIDERVLVTIYDIKKIKSKPWFRIFCGDLASRYSKIETIINNNVHLTSFIEDELVRFKTTINS